MESLRTPVRETWFIIEKRLGNEEEICINKNDIIAFSKGVKVSESNIARSYKAFLIND